MCVLFMDLDPQLLISRGEAIEERDPETAARLYEEALRQENDHPHVWSNLGNCYFRLSDHEQAELCWAKAIELDPLMPEPYYNLGCLCLQQEQLRASVEFLRKSIELDPDHSDAYFNLGIVTEKLGLLNESLAARRIYLQRTWTTNNPKEHNSLLKKVRKLERQVMG